MEQNMYILQHTLKLAFVSVTICPTNYVYRVGWCWWSSASTAKYSEAEARCQQDDAELLDESKLAVDGK